ncbi:MAG: hypothetical protein O2788_03650 [Chloroflexi bacterium]|nr:hypothetical protein [Chloroflexota bacterium]
MENSGTGQIVERFLPLRGKNVVLGITGSIAAYKAADLTSKLVPR